MSEEDFEFADYDDGPDPVTVGFLTRDEEIRVAAVTAAAQSQATGDYKPSGGTVVEVAKVIERYIRSGK